MSEAGMGQQRPPNAADAAQAGGPAAGGAAPGAAAGARRPGVTVAGIAVTDADAPDGAPRDDDSAPRDDSARDDGASGDDAPDGPDWAWVEEWRESGEPPAWAPGTTVAVFTTIVVGLAIFVLSDGLSGIPWLAVAANVLVAVGLAPALWLSRRLPVLRWISAGAAVGVVVGWIGALIN